MGPGGVGEKGSMNIPIKVSDPRFIPAYAHPGDAGADLKAAQYSVIHPDKTVVVGTGVYAAIPEGFVGLVMPRSGLASRGIVAVPGTIDSGYRGEIKVVLHNTGNEPYTVCKHDRIAQLEILPVVRAQFDVVSDLGATERGSEGLGSTGR